MIIHKTRSILEIIGLDRKKFLQGLVTNDVNLATQNNLIYSAMLNSAGRFLYDFFIFEDGEKLVLDCHIDRRDEIFKKLNFYKLRSQVEITKNDELLVGQILENTDSDFSKDIKTFADPRSSMLGKRAYGKNLQSTDSISYEIARIKNKIPQGEDDLTYEKSFILEFGFDELNAVNYEKGCYVGQELTARTHHLGEIRKKICHITIEDAEAIEKNSEITCERKSTGIILSSIFYQGELHALALIRLPADQELKWNNNKITIVA